MKKITIILFLILNSISIRAKDGDLDLTFNKTGKVTISGKLFSITYGTLVQPDKKIIATGTIDTKFAVVRLNVDGSLDKSFGSGGKAILPIINTDSLRQANVLASKGKIVITGVSDDQIIIARLNSNGKLDTTFGSDGIVRFTLGYSIDSNAIKLQKNGKIVVGGDSYSGRALNVSRLNVNGSLDSSFNDGVHTTGNVLILFDLNAFANGIAIQNDGKILLCGTIANFFSIIRLQNNGALDLNFGPFGLGYVPIVSGVAASANSIVLQPDQKIIVGGKSDSKFVLARLTTDGSLDTTFNGIGFVQTPIAQFATIQSIILQPWDGKIVVGGYSVSNTQRFTLARYTTNGKLDTSFGNKGIVLTKFNNNPVNEAVNSVALDIITRKVIAAGYTNKKSAIARYIASIPLAIISPINNSTVTYPVTFTGTGIPGTKLKIQILNVQTGRKFFGSVLVNASGTWTFVPTNLILGKNIITVTEILTSSMSITFILGSNTTANKL